MDMNSKPRAPPMPRFTLRPSRKSWRGSRSAMISVPSLTFSIWPGSRPIKSPSVGLGKRRVAPAAQTEALDRLTTGRLFARALVNTGAQTGKLHLTIILAPEPAAHCNRNIAGTIGDGIGPVNRLTPVGRGHYAQRRDNRNVYGHRLG